ncbi:unnamed protein product [Cochlearia groenlandica]
MATARSVMKRLGLDQSLAETQIGASRAVKSAREKAFRCFSDDRDRILNQEELAKETIYIHVFLLSSHSSLPLLVLFAC